MGHSLGCGLASVMPPMFVWALCEVVHAGWCGLMTRCSGHSAGQASQVGRTSCCLTWSYEDSGSRPSPTPVIYRLWGHLPLRSPLFSVEELGRYENVYKWKLEIIDNPSHPQKCHCVIPTPHHHPPPHLTSGNSSCKHSVLSKLELWTLAQCRERTRP